MPTPKKKTSRSRRDMRRSHDALKNRALSVDPVSGETHLRHHMTPDGFYRGRQIIKTEVEVEEVQE